VNTAGRRRHPERVRRNPGTGRWAKPIARPFRGSAGQIFTLDIFSAFGIFMLIMFLILIVSTWAALTAREIQLRDSMTREALAASDVLVYSPNYTTSPYRLNSTAMTAFTTMGGGVAGVLKFSNNFSIKVVRLNDSSVIHSVGTEPRSARTVVAVERRAYYNDTDVKLIVTVWRTFAGAGAIPR
jgi:hypothetical protein